MQPEAMTMTDLAQRRSSTGGRLPAVALVGAGVLAALLLVFAGPLPAFAFIALLVAVVLSAYPFLALNLLLAVSALDAVNTLVPSDVYQITGTKLVGYVLAVALVLDVVLRRSNLRLDAVAVLLLAFLGGLLASLWGAADYSLAFREGLRFLQLAVLFVAVRQLVTTRDRLVVVAKVVTLTLGLSAVAGIHQFFFSEDRISGVSQNAAILAADLMVAAAFAVVLFSQSCGGRRRLLWAAVGAILMLCLAMTESRSAFIALPLAFVAAALIVGRRLALAVPVLILATVGFLAIGGVGGRFVEFSELADTSSQGHLKTLMAGLRMIQDNPVLGVGLGNYQFHYLSYSNDIMGLPKTAHNTYLSFAAECGIPLLLVFIGFAGACLLRAADTGFFWRRRGYPCGANWAAAIIFALVAMLVTAFFHTLNTNKYLWLLLALAAQLPSINMNGHVEPLDDESPEDQPADGD